MTHLLVALLSLTATTAEETPAARHGWLLSLDEGRQQARVTGKPLMVVLRCEA